ncbi:transcriptional regulator [Streptomyces davaonensis JCM 4913]|uniref:Transcriptional regulator n=1 Tax=Streptomyces davaonensis (strain DSM 101723 / JCM 4913 / KCC S-0913 / 768) TaxID=1214101 RepID=K4QX62_STRDJ|nr:LCP family protein [Streptomyces davaonensis]CCK25638.1 transcriptional regulator [Streptomyces davaonensis JCM 4913]
MSDWSGRTPAPRVIQGQVVAQTEETRPYQEPRPHEELPGGGTSRGTRPPWVRPSRRRRIARLSALLLCALLLTGGGTYAWADLELDRSVDLGSVPGRPSQGKGSTYLIVGSDSRDGLSEQAKQDLHAGGGGGGRTDAMMLLHTGAHGTTLVSLPRDSWVTLPSYVDPDTGKRHHRARNKLNAAYSLGGARLLVRTVELNTSLRVDHYAEIGFGGFVGVVDAVGGVDMCLDRNIKDEKSGLDLTRGCHTLDGAQALAFVRQRHQEAEGDLGRSKNQQKFLAALAHKAATPGTALNPFRSYPLLGAALDTLVVDKDMQLSTLVSLFQAMRGVSSGAGEQISVPLAGPGISTSKGSAVKWDPAKAQRLFTELRNDRPVSVEEENRRAGG